MTTQRLKGQGGPPPDGPTRAQLIRWTVGLTLLIAGALLGGWWLVEHGADIDFSRSAPVDTPAEETDAADPTDEAENEDGASVPQTEPAGGTPGGEEPAIKDSPFGAGDETEPGGLQQSEPVPAGPTRGPLVIQRVQPVYPSLARQARMTGTVTLRAMVTPLGTVQSVSDIKGNPVLGKAAAEAVMQWRYQPALENGVPVASWADVEINFTLN